MDGILHSQIYTLFQNGMYYQVQSRALKLEIRNWKLDHVSTSFCFSQFQVSDFPAKKRNQQSVNYFLTLMKDASSRYQNDKSGFIGGCSDSEKLKKHTSNNTNLLHPPFDAVINPAL